jgi:transposase InsO family protein
VPRCGPVRHRFKADGEGTELTSNAILKWCAETKIEWHYIAPGKPMQNGFVESFNGRMREVPVYGELVSAIPWEQGIKQRFRET